MDRRSFLKSTGSLAAAASLSKRTLAALAPLAAGRTVYAINSNWRYSATPAADFHSAGFDDSAIERVTVPHTNKRVPWHGFDDAEYEFISGYRRPLAIPAGAAAGKRVFADFEGVMLASTVYCNGKRLGEYKGGYTPFSFELTEHLKPSGNVLSVAVDSTERKDIPPFGNEVDYLTFGGIYREVALRIVPQVFLENIHVHTRDVLSKPAVDVDVYLDRAASANPRALSIRAELRDGDTVLATATMPVRTPAPTLHHSADADQAMGALAYDPAKDAPAATLTLIPGAKVSLWDLNNPKLYTVHVQLLEANVPIDQDTRRLGFREAKFTPQGFSLNGSIVKLHGLDRHQTFPWVGQAMPARPQRQDAKILRYDCRCNIVRTSHYPQSRHFLDACDEIGLLVLEEIPGWQHIGDHAWQDIAVDNVRRMVRRDWNHPSIILWGVRINESADNHDFYVRTNALAHALDTTRQTGGIRTGGNWNSELLEDVFTVNDFGWPMRKPNHPLFLNTEFVGHTFPTKTVDAYERQREHVVRHARVHDNLASDPQYAGGIGWCAFDYNTHDSFGAGDRICYHGVMDIFRTPKPAAGFYKSMAAREDEIVLEPAFYWGVNDESEHFDHALICSNVDTIRITTTNDRGEHLIAEGGPDRVQFPHLKYPPFTFLVGPNISKKTWGDVRIDGMIDGKVVITKRASGSGADHQLLLLPDETSLVADGADSVRVVLRSVDAYGSLRHYAADAITFELTGPATLIGDNPFGLIGGTGAIWLRTTHTPGTITLVATHPYLGKVTATLTSAAAPAETV